MNKHRTKRLGALVAASTVALLGIAGCTGAPGGGSDEEVTITWWHNATNDPLQGIWEEVAAEFEEANPGVTVEVTGYQNEDLQRTLIPNALQSGDAPDVFMVWPGGEVRSQAEAGYLKDLSEPLADEIAAFGGVVKPWEVDGAQYGMPFSFGITGIWYNTELFEQAGIEGTPETLPELVDAVEALKGIDVEPIAVGAGDLWPAGHWWYQFALNACSTETLQSSIADLDFEDPCWVEAGEMLEDFLAEEPFNEGFLATPAQTGADSSNGLMANGTAAMEFMGPWNSGTIGALTADATVPEWLGWFPFPSVPGAAGDPTITMGGGDGWGVSADAPDAAVELVRYLSTADVQRRFAAAGSGIPSNPEAADALTDANLQAIAEGLAGSSYVQLLAGQRPRPGIRQPAEPGHREHLRRDRYP